MYKFFVEPEQIGEDTVFITGEDVNHIVHVLRMKKGEQVLVSTSNDREYLCEITALEEEAVQLKLLDVYGSNRELPIEVTLYQALPKGDKMETVIQKMVELGAVRIVPVVTKRCVVQLDQKKAAKKVARWNAISEAAAKQSKRNKIPEVMMPMSFAEALLDAKKLEAALIPYENAEGMEQARCMVDEAVKKRSLGIFIGPEGGFTEQEIEKSQQNGVKPISLGHRILRTETAGMMLMSVIMFATDQD